MESIRLKLSEWQPGLGALVYRNRFLQEFMPRPAFPKERAKPVQQLKPLSEEVKPVIDIPKHLASIMVERGRDDVWLACQLGITSKSFMRYLTGERTPSLDKLAQMAWMLECSIDRIIHGPGY